MPDTWTVFHENLASLPTENGLYAVYESIPSDFWDTLTYTNDHPVLLWFVLLAGTDCKPGHCEGDRREDLDEFKNGNQGMVPGFPSNAWQVRTDENTSKVV